MSYELIGSGGILGIGELSQYESSIAEGDRAVIQLDLRTSLPNSVIQELQDRLIQAGVEEAQVTTGSPIINIYFRKGFPWLAVIVGIILAMTIIAILVIGWRIFKEVVPAGLQPAVGTALIIGLAVLGLVIAYKVVRR